MDPDSGDSVLMGIAAGRYLDHFQRREGSWKIRARRIVMHWTREDFDGAAWEKIDGRPARGRRRDVGDESYEFFGVIGEGR